MNNKYMLAIAAFAFVAILSVCALSVSDDSSADSDAKLPWTPWSGIDAYESPFAIDEFKLKFTDSEDDMTKIDVTAKIGIRSWTTAVPRHIVYTPMDTVTQIKERLHDEIKAEYSEKSIIGAYEYINEKYPDKVKEAKEFWTYVYDLTLADIYDELYEYVEFVYDVEDEVEDMLNEPVIIDIANKGSDELKVEVVYDEVSADYECPREITVDTDTVVKVFDPFVVVVEKFITNVLKEFAKVAGIPLLKA